MSSDMQNLQAFAPMDEWMDLNSGFVPIGPMIRACRLTGSSAFPTVAKTDNLQRLEDDRGSK